MHIHESVFWGIVFFLAGVFMAPDISLAALTAITAIIAVTAGSIAHVKRNKRLAWFAGLMVFAIVGGIYWGGYNVYQRNKVAYLVGKQVEIKGRVISIRKSEKSQQAVIKIDDERGGKVSVVARLSPTLKYGDAVALKGSVNRPDKKNKTYLLRDAIFASMTFPSMTVIRRGDGNPIMMRLVGVRKAAVGVYKQLLPKDEAALLAGITLGERAEFDKEFKQKMANSGTTHLVALSGYNIAVVAEAILLICGFIMRRTAAFYATLATIAAFVIMAGAEASVVRAAIMGSIVLLAGHIGRAHSMRNAIAVSACAMVLWNPNVLRYDLGFQLSFLALIGIVYAKPYLDGFIKRKKNGLLDWRENLSGTLSAQLMVFPILMNSVGSFSLVSLVSNIAILVFIPVTMGLGFATAALGFIAQPIAQLPAWIASLLLKYEIAIIELFGAYKGFSIPMTAGWVLIYYALMGWLLWYLHKAICASCDDANVI